MNYAALNQVSLWKLSFDLQQLEYIRQTVALEPAVRPILQIVLDATVKLFHDAVADETIADKPQVRMISSYFVLGYIYIYINRLIFPIIHIVFIFSFIYTFIFTCTFKIYICSFLV